MLEPILQALAIPLPMIVLDEFRQGASEMPLPQRNDPIETFCFDRPNKTLGVGDHPQWALKNVCQDVGRCGEARDPLPLPAIQPAGEHIQHHLQRRGVDHEPELTSRPGWKDVG